MKKLIQHYGGTIIVIIAVAIILALISFLKIPLKNAEIKHINDLARMPGNILTEPADVEIDDAGLFDADGTQIYSWDELIAGGYITVSGDIVKGGTNAQIMEGRLVISKKITGIAANAFDGCKKLTAVDCQEGLTNIGDAAFDHCSSLKSFKMSASVNTLGDWVFANCPELVDINVDAGNDSFLVDNGVLFSKNKDTLYRCIESKTGEYVFPDETVKIKKGAFENCASITYINTNNLDHIDISSFANCSSLKKIDIPKEYATREFRYAAFKNCYELEEVNMANITSSFAGSVFENCYKLKKIQVPDNVYKFGYRTFSQCNSLTSINLPAAMRGLDEETLKGTNITTITLPDKISWLSARALSYIPTLKSVTYKGTTYTSTSKLLSVLEADGVELFEDIFIGSGIEA